MNFSTLTEQIAHVAVGKYRWPEDVAIAAARAYTRQINDDSPCSNAADLIVDVREALRCE